MNALCVFIDNDEFDSMQLIQVDNVNIKIDFVVDDKSVKTVLNTMFYIEFVKNSKKNRTLDRTVDPGEGIRYKSPSSLRIFF